MQGGKFCVLILEDSQVVVTQITQAFKKEMSDVVMLAARSIAEAQILVSEFAVDFFILDIHLPDGNGIDFLCDIQMTHADAKVVIMTAVPLPEYKQRAEALGVIRFIEKPVEPTGLVQLAKDHKSTLSTGAGAAPAEAFQASLSCLTTIDIIQLKCLSQVTQVMEFVRPDGVSGKIHFSKGRVIHSELGDKHGVAAFNVIVGWKGGRVNECPNPSEPIVTISLDWQTLLMEAVQGIDESTAPPGSLDKAAA